MEACIYEKLHDDFVMLRSLTSGLTEDKCAMQNVLTDLGRILPYLEKYGTEDEKNVLGYAVRTALELGTELLPYRHLYNPKHLLFRLDRRGRKVEMLNCFCDAVHNLCELFTGTAWSKEQYSAIFIAPFRERYGVDFFGDVLYFFGESAMTEERV